MRIITGISLLLVSQSALAFETKVGYAHSYNTIQSGLHNQHPYISFEEKFLSSNFFINSRRVWSLGAYIQKKYTKLNFDFTLKLGVVTGYREKFTYRDKEYTSALPVYRGFMPSFAPSLTYNVSKYLGISFEQLGDEACVSAFMKF